MRFFDVACVSQMRAGSDVLAGETITLAYSTNDGHGP
jgi:hypothetical protein